MALINIMLYGVILLLFGEGELIKIDQVNRESLVEATNNYNGKSPSLIDPQFPTVCEDWTPDWKLYFIYPYILFDPLSQFEFLFQNDPLICPLCESSHGETGPSYLRQTNLWKNGEKERRNPRMLYDIISIAYLVYKTYSCANGHTEIPATHPDIMERIPDCYLPFILKHRCGMTTRCVEWIADRSDAGLSIRSVESTFKENYEKQLCSRLERFWTDYRFATNVRQNEIATVPSPDDLYKETKGYIPTKRIITDIVVGNFKRFEPLISKQFSSAKAKWISCDHTFKTAANIGYHRDSDGKWIKQYKAVFCILNEMGQVVQWQFTTSEGFDELRPMFENLRKRFDNSGTKLSAIFIDNCCKWRDSLASIFPGIPVKLDLFHAVQRVVREVPKRSTFSKEFSNEFGLVFRQNDDHGVRRTKPTPTSNVILKNIEQLICKWNNVKHDDGTAVLSKTVLSEIDNLRRHITKGCLSDIEVGCGTSRDERLHREMNKILSTKAVGAELAYVRLTELFMVENKKRSGETLWSTVPELKVIFAEEMVRGRDVQTTISGDHGNGQSEEFGIRSKTSETKNTNIPEENSAKSNYKIGQFTTQDLYDLQNYIETQIQVMLNHAHDSSGEENSDDVKRSVLLEIIKQALTWWSTSLCIQSIIGARCVKKKDIPSIVRSRMNCKVNAHTEHPKSGQHTDAEMGELIASFGYSVVDIPPDGDCLFTATAFQVLQLINCSNVCSHALKEHLERIGINIKNASINFFAEKLRSLVVNEWQGEFCEEYMDFFSAPVGESNVDPKLMFMQEAEKFRKMGVFAASLGDAVPLALANILHLPLMILTARNARVFTDICPRFLITAAEPIFLVHYTDGPGHYNALVKTDVDGTNMPSASPSEKMAEDKPKFVPMEKRLSRKRKRHDFQTSRKKSKDFLLSKKECVKEGPLNLAEHFLIRAIMNEVLVKTSGKDFQSTVVNLYKEAVSLMKDDSVLRRIPVSTYKESKLKKSIRKMLKEDDKQDYISN